LLNRLGFDGEFFFFLISDLLLNHFLRDDFLDLVDFEHLLVFTLTKEYSLALRLELNFFFVKELIKSDFYLLIRLFNRF
jgi:hypothetical protein